MNVGVEEAERTTQGTFLIRKLNRFGSLGRAGIVAGDEIIAMNGTSPQTLDQVWEILAAAGVGATVTYRVSRMGTVFDLPVELLEKRSISFDLEDVNLDLDRKIAP